MKSVTSKASIYVNDAFGIAYHVCDIEYTIREDDTFRYIFKPCYSVIDLLNSDIFQGIPGLNLNLRLKEYKRENIVPVFISERVPSINREDLPQLLLERGLKYLDPIQYMINDFNKYSGDNFYVQKYHDKQTINVKEESLLQRNTQSTILYLLKIIANGDDVTGLFNIDDNNRHDIYQTMIVLYRRSYLHAREHILKGIKSAKNKHIYRGRKPIEVDHLKFLELEQLIKQGDMQVGEAIKVLGISRDKYYRYRKTI